MRQAPMPGAIKPMLATLTDAPFDKEDWIYEIKWDGYRAVGYADGDSIELVSRNLKPFTEKYDPVAEALRELHIRAVMDGEIVAVNDQGLADFQSLQNWQNTPVHLQYFIFDLMWIDGYDITRLPLIERKRLLCELIPDHHPVLKYSTHIKKDGVKFFNAALAQGLEGIMAKKGGSPYLIDER